MFSNMLERTKALYQSDNMNPEKFYDFGNWVHMNTATLGLDTGVFLIAAPPNLGKSAILLNMYCQLLKYNENIHVLDFSLDDNFEDRTRNAVSRIAKIPINWVKLPSGIEEQAKEARKHAYSEWAKQYIPNLDIIDETDFEGTARRISKIKDAVKTKRAALPKSTRLFVVVDGFHNVQVDEIRGDKLEKEIYLSQEFKQLMADTKSVMFASAHVPKSNAKRGTNWTAVKGAGDIGYDAKIITTIYSDLAVNRGHASIFHQATLPHAPQITATLPVIELDVVKNKASSFKDVIFYKFFPEYAYVEEAPEQYQVAWKQQIHEGSSI